MNTISCCRCGHPILVEHEPENGHGILCRICWEDKDSKERDRHLKQCKQTNVERAVDRAWENFKP